MTTTMTERETCQGCGAELDDEAVQRGWPIPAGGDEGWGAAFVGPCCYEGETHCSAGHLLRGDTEGECDECDEDDD